MNRAGNKIIFFVGTVAETIKLAPVMSELSSRDVRYLVVASGQNKIAGRELQHLIKHLKIDYQLPYKSARSSTLSFVTWASKAFLTGLFNYRKLWLRARANNAMVVVHGDTVSSLIGAAIAKLFGLKVAHVESGLRSFRFDEPFPEEICRVCVSVLSDIHFCPNSWAASNLGSRKSKINTEHNTGLDSLRLAQKASNSVKRICSEKYFVVVMHRQEHMLYQKDFTKWFIQKAISKANRDLKCVIVMHQLTRNFFVNNNIIDMVETNPDIIEVPRLRHHEFVSLIAKAEFVATDGGSNQEELYYLGVPCLILRKVTERIEGLGENALLSKCNKREINKFLHNYSKYKKRTIKPTVSPSRIIANYIIQHV